MATPRQRGSHHTRAATPVADTSGPLPSGLETAPSDYSLPAPLSSSTKTLHGMTTGANGMSAQLSPTQRLLAWFAGSFALLAGVVTLVGTIRGTLDPGVAIAAFAPLIGGLFAAIVAKATADRDKDD